MTVTARLKGWPPFSPEKTWSRADSDLYLSIARHGYSIFRCRSHLYPGSWCGNAGWFPAYPWLIRALHLFAIPFAPAALAVAWLAELATLVVLWQGFLHRQPRRHGLVVLAYAAVAPGLVYDFGLFPLSLLSLCTVTTFVFVDRGRWLLAGVSAAIGTLSYPVGVAVIPVAAIWVMRRPGELSERLRRLGLLAGLPLGALVLFALDQRLETGHWNAYLLDQAKYNHAIAVPIIAFIVAVHTIVTRDPVDLAAGHLVHTIAPALQTVLVTAVLVSILLEVRHEDDSATDTFIALYAFVAWLIVNSTSNLSDYRGEAALFSFAPLVSRLPTRLAGAFALAALVLVVPMTSLYLRGLLL